jgi:DNA-binding XRE family transcriptional regulator
MDKVTATMPEGQPVEDWSDLPPVAPPPNDIEKLREAAEDAYDILCVLKAQLALATGQDEWLPGDMVFRLFDPSVSRITVWREHRGLSQKDLAAKAGMTAAQLCEIEGGKRSGSIATLRKIAKALGVTVNDLLPPED